MFQCFDERRNKVETAHSFTFRVPSSVLVLWYFFSSDWNAAYYFGLVAASFWGLVADHFMFAFTMFDMIRMS